MGVSNILVTSEGVIGIDQQVNVIRDNVGLNTYLERVRSFIGAILQTNASEKHSNASSGNSEHVSATVSARIKAACVTMQDSHAASLLEGLRMGILEVAHGWNAGTVQTAIQDAEIAASEQIVASQKLYEDGGWTLP